MSRTENLRPSDEEAGVSLPHVPQTQGASWTSSALSYTGRQLFILAELSQECAGVTKGRTGPLQQDTDWLYASCLMLFGPATQTAQVRWGLSVMLRELVGWSPPHPSSAT